MYGCSDSEGPSDEGPLVLVLLSRLGSAGRPRRAAGTPRYADLTIVTVVPECSDISNSTESITSRMMKMPRPEDAIHLSGSVGSSTHERSNPFPSSWTAILIRPGSHSYRTFTSLPPHAAFPC